MNATEQNGQPQDRRSPVSDEELRDYARRLRSAPVEQVIADVLISVLNAAQVKLGRRDARLLIDLSTLMHAHVRDYVSADLTKQIDQLLGQLRLGQVSAENRARQKGEAEPNDLDRIPTPPTTGAGGTPASPPPSQPKPPPSSSKLWVPGQ